MTNEINKGRKNEGTQARKKERKKGRKEGRKDERTKEGMKGSKNELKKRTNEEVHHGEDGDRSREVLSSR